ncbi:MAG: gluconokinase, GntK/IdnK-type [Rhodanobacter sp.]
MSAEANAGLVIVVMGVSGSGKSTLGQALAEAEGWDFQEGDALHPRANIDKMRGGEPLDDGDRAPWLERISAWIANELRLHRHGVITCSALKRDYRQRLMQAGTGVRFVHLDAAHDVLQRRLRQRDHFMPASLLDSQLQTLEAPLGEDATLIVSSEDPPGVVLAKVREWIAHQTPGTR